MSLSVDELLCWKTELMIFPLGWTWRKRFLYGETIKKWSKLDCISSFKDLLLLLLLWLLLAIVLNFLLKNRRAWSACWYCAEDSWQVSGWCFGQQIRLKFILDKWRDIKFLLWLWDHIFLFFFKTGKDMIQDWEVSLECPCPTVQSVFSLHLTASNNIFLNWTKKILYVSIQHQT